MLTVKRLMVPREGMPKSRMRNCCLAPQTRVAAKQSPEDDLSWAFCFCLFFSIAFLTTDLSHSYESQSMSMSTGSANQRSPMLMEKTAIPPRTPMETMHLIGVMDKPLGIQLKEAMGKRVGNAEEAAIKIEDTIKDAREKFGAC